MRVIAPGKLLLTGAYAVLEGAPAMVVAVDRYAIADDVRGASPPAREVRVAFGDGQAPSVDASGLYLEGHKLGLGSSAAVLVSSLGLREARRGADLASPDTRRLIFDTARKAHAQVQGGGSGVDIAASVYGGLLRYTLNQGHGEVTPLGFPEELSLAVFWTGASARTSELRGRVDALRVRDPAIYRARMGALVQAAHGGADAMVKADAEAFVPAARATYDALAALGLAAEVAIVSAPMKELTEHARAEDGAFFPSGAGGGDVAVFVGMGPVSQAFLSHAHRLGFRPVPVGMDMVGVRVSA
ncbi:MAG: hypothetical protein WCI05_19710 [Myxococcales bacterium]